MDVKVLHFEAGGMEALSVLTFMVSRAPLWWKGSFLLRLVPDEHPYTFSLPSSSAVGAFSEGRKIRQNG